MKAAGISILIICLAQIAQMQAEDPMRMVERVMRMCRDRHRIQASDIENAIKNKKLPTDSKGRGFLLCIIKEVGFNQLKNMIRGGTKLKGEMASLIEIPEFEKELEDASHSLIT